MTTTTHDTAQSGRLRYLAFNVVVWILLFAGGTAALFVMRRYGQDYLERMEAQAQLDQAHALFQQGDSSAAQQAALRVLRARPGMTDYFLNTMGTDVLGLPQVYDYLSKDSPALEQIDALPRAQALILSGNVNAAKALMIQLAAKDELAAPGRLWLARMYLDEGRIHDAQAHFRAYWEERSGQRDSRVEAIVNTSPGGRAAPERAYSLFWEGLWETSFEIARSQGDQGNASLRALLGVAQELAGDTDKALKTYNGVLAELPNHRLSRQRVTALEGRDENR